MYLNIRNGHNTKLIYFAACAAVNANAGKLHKQGAKQCLVCFSTAALSPSKPSAQFRIEPLIVAQMDTHEAFPEFAVIRNEKMKQFMNDDIIPEVRFQPDQFTVEIQMSAGGA